MLPIRDHMTLRLAATPYKFPAAREADALELLGYRPAIFWRRVNHLLDQPAAVVVMPVEVGRLRRLRERRAGARRVVA